MKALVLDISKWDPNIDLKAWKNKHNLWGVIIKAGGNEGGRYKDAYFERHYQNAKNAGLHIGAYYYTVSTSTSACKQDADHFANLLAGKSFDLPAYMDVEDPRQVNMAARPLTDIIKVFCNQVKARGYYPGIYVMGSVWMNKVYRSELMDYADWVAWWKATWPTQAGDIGMWQQGGMRYSDGNIVYDDVSGYVDVNWCVVDYPSKIKGGGDTPIPAPTPQPSGQLEVDGYCGPATTTEWQKQMGTYQDGIISGQDKVNKPYMERFTSVSWEADGESQLVKAVQKKIGTAADGFIGPNTVKALQTYLNNRGNYGLAVDGLFGHNSAMALQKSLNSKLW